jgi:hypothetical protein
MRCAMFRVIVNRRNIDTKDKENSLEDHQKAGRLTPIAMTETNAVLDCKVSQNA